MAGAIASFFIILLSDDEELYKGHKVPFLIGTFIAIAIVIHTWLVVYNLYQEYTFLMFTTAFRGAMAMQPNIAIIESGYNPHHTYSRNKVGVY